MSESVFDTDNAKVLLSGEYSRRRGYLTNVIAGLNSVAIVGTLTIWSFCISWDALIGKEPSYELFAAQIAYAGAVSSVLIGLWRFYVRYLDGKIIELYPAMYLCELILMPEEVLTIKPPTNVDPLSKNDISDRDKVKWEPVCYEKFSGRGHQVIDRLAYAIIIFFGVLSIYVAWKWKIVKIFQLGTPHLIGWLLFANVISVLLIYYGRWRWSQKVINWPSPKPK